MPSPGIGRMGDSLIIFINLLVKPSQGPMIREGLNMVYLRPLCITISSASAFVLR